MSHNYITQILNSNHIKDSFNCGNDLLNGYIQKQASQDVKRKLSACFILAEKDNLVKGFYTLSSSSIDKNSIPVELTKKLPNSYINLPVTLLGRLAVDIKHKGKGLGELLLIDALKRSHSTIQQIASMAVIVDPIDKEAQNFYLKYGFILLPDSGKMLITMNTITKLFS